jgi:hypothetical protein
LVRDVVDLHTGDARHVLDTAGDNPISNYDPGGLGGWGHIWGGLIAIGRAVTVVATAPITVPLLVGEGIKGFGGAPCTFRSRL